MLSIKVIGQNTLINNLIDQCKSSTKYNTDTPANMYVNIQVNNVSYMFQFLYLLPLEVCQIQTPDIIYQQLC